MNKKSMKGVCLTRGKETFACSSQGFQKENTNMCDTGVPCHIRFHLVNPMFSCLQNYVFTQSIHSFDDANPMH